MILSSLTETLFGPSVPNALFIIFQLVLIEGLLSVDNAAVLAAMVRDLPEEQRGRALKYGIIGAYVFRGLCLVFANYIMEFKAALFIGGAYLLYLSISHLLKKEGEALDEEENIDKQQNWFYKIFIGSIGVFWSTVIVVEFMDLLFSLDNVVAAVGFVKTFPQPSKYIIVCTGVFIGILSMRFIAQWFIKLLDKYPALNTSAFIVIGILGLKLIIDFACKVNWLPHGFCEFLETNSHSVDFGLSIFNMVVFVIPLFIKKVEDKEI